jgi:hypothetical protein
MIEGDERASHLLQSRDAASLPPEKHAATGEDESGAGRLRLTADKARLRSDGSARYRR